jgi:hypothetical protein
VSPGPEGNTLLAKGLLGDTESNAWSYSASMKNSFRSASSSRVGDVELSAKK